MTVRHYYTDAYRAEFTAAVVERSDDGIRVYLDETAFYPTSGGQPHDIGTLGGVAVVDVVDEADRVAHVLSAPIGASEPRLVGRIDWVRRYDHMQQHTGQHLLSAVFEDLFGAKTVSVHFGPESSTLDLEIESLTREQLVAAETRANELVGEARPVAVTFEEAATAQGLRKASERTGMLRVVSIEGVDRSACGGTHVRSTAEIGTVLVRSSEKIRKATRVEFVCGRRALRRARRDLDALSAIASSLSASLDDSPAVVATQSERLRDAENARKKMDRELSGYRVRERYDATTPGADGVRTIVVRDATSIDDLRAFAQAAFALPRVVVVGALMSPASVLLASSEDSGVDAGRILKEKLAAVGGRGGGSPRLAQGSVPDASAVESVVSSLVNRGG
ncbi:MAG TPA: DHHA1 domain-containing protein [Gemmatimonadaceae bacterium]|jgi:alanyl-tRNA synthetase|nr:DHHA1 domain-containing protein [Gemmatimonadaceae bacterium]